MTSIQIILCCIIGLMALFIINGQIYLRSKRGWMKWLYHDICKWHVPSYHHTRGFACITQYSTCKHCHQRICKYGTGDWQRW